MTKLMPFPGARDRYGVLVVIDGDSVDQRRDVEDKYEHEVAIPAGS